MSWRQSHCPPGFHPPPLLHRLWSVSVEVLSHRRVYSRPHCAAQSQLLTAFNWIIITIFSIIIFVRMIITNIQKRLFNFSCFWALPIGHYSKYISAKKSCYLWPLYVMNCEVCVQLHICYCSSLTDCTETIFNK